MSVTTTEFKLNMEKYLLLSRTEDVLISEEGKIIAKITKPDSDEERVEKVRALFGIIPEDVDVDAILEERLNKL